MKSSFLGAKPFLTGALTLGALALAGCGGGTSPQRPTPTATPNPNATATPVPTADPASVLANTIVFVSNRDGNNEIYSMRADGSQQTRLTTSPAQDNTPTRSRDGRRVVFSSLRAGNPEIYTMGIEGETASLLRLTTDTGVSAPDDTAPVFSADGSRIAWISTRGGSSNVWLMDSTGANQRQLTTEGNISSVAFSPDGAEVAFAVARPVSGTNGAAANSVIVGRNIASGSERTIAQGAFAALSPRYNPSGSTLVFTASPSSGSGAGRLRLVNLATGAISDGPGQGNTNQNLAFVGNGAFSPNGNQIVAVTGPVQSSGTMGGQPQIGIAAVAGNSTITVLAGGGSVNLSPSWGQ